MTEPETRAAAFEEAARVANDLLGDASNFPFAFLDGQFVIGRNEARDRTREAILDLARHERGNERSDD